MKRKVFDVVKLVDENMATILEVELNTYKVEIVDKKGKTKEIKEIKEEDIKDVIIAK